MDELNKQTDKAEISLQMTQSENARLNQVGYSDDFIEDAQISKHSL